jgi:hypothetical protein
MVLGFFFALMARYRRIKSETRKIAAVHTNGNGHRSKKHHKHEHKEHAVEED